MILIIIKFCELLLRISPRIINSLRSYIKHEEECFLLFPNTSMLVVWKSEETLLLVFDLLRQNHVGFVHHFSAVKTIAVVG